MSALVVVVVNSDVIAEVKINLIQQDRYWALLEGGGAVGGWGRLFFWLTGKRVKELIF